MDTANAESAGVEAHRLTEKADAPTFATASVPSLGKLRTDTKAEPLQGTSSQAKATAWTLLQLQARVGMRAMQILACPLIAP